MKTNLISIALLALASSLITFEALGQPGVWVAHGSSLYWTCVASSADGSKLVATAQSANSLYTSTDSGTTWTLHNSSHAWSPVASSADGTKLIAGADSLLWLSTDSGTNWNNPPGGGPVQGWTAVASSSDGTKLAALGGLIYTSADSGATWTAHAWGGHTGGYSAFSIASSSDGTKLVATTYGEHIYTSADSGTTWIAHGPSHYWSGVASSADGTRLVALDGGGGGGGYIYTSTDSGTNWTQRGIFANWSRVASSADGTRLVATYGGTSGQIYISTDSGTNWSASGSAANWGPVASSADGYLLVAAVYGGQIYTYLAPVANDLCSGAIALSSGVTYSMDTTHATSTSDPTPTCQTIFGKGVWFKYTPTGTGPVLVSTCGSSFDTVLAVYSGSCGALTPVSCDDDYGPACSGTQQASLTFSGTAGTTYYILAGGYASAAGTLQIVAQVLNDQCPEAIPLTDSVTYSMSTADATSTGDPAPVCESYFGKGVWFTFTPAINGEVQVYTCGSDYDTVLQVYTGSCGSLSPVAGGCDDDASCSSGIRQSYVAFVGTPGTTYYILAGGYGGYSGNLEVTASVVPVVIFSQPAGGTTNAGDSFTFSVGATGPSPLSYQWQLSGTNLPGTTNSTLALNNLYPGNAGNYQVIVSNIYGGSVTSSVATLNVLPALDLALDTTGLSWSTGGGYDGYGWYRQTDVSHDGVDSAECGSPVLVIPYSFAWMETTVTGPGTLTFYWHFYKSIGSWSTDYLGFFMDGVYQAGVGSPFAAWSYPTTYVGTGSHTLRWVYVRGTGSIHGGGPGYVDQVNLTGGATAAFIVTQPTPQTAVAGSSAVFTVGASGTPPFTYQWQFNGNPIANATNSSLTLTNVQPIQGSNYSVVVANGYGTPVTSSSAALTVTTIPLPVAVDYAGPSWNASGNAQWFGQVSVTHDGTDAAQSGWMTNNQQGYLDTTLAGPGTLSFWWKVSSETNYDYLKFFVNGVLKTNISGEVDWQQQTFSLPAGSQTLRWAYTKDVSLSRGSDAAWVDQVSYDGPPTLSISPLPPQQVLLFWPTSATSYVLQSTTNLAATISWQSVTDVPAVLDNNWAVTNATGLRQFYHLKK